MEHENPDTTSSTKSEKEKPRFTYTPLREQAEFRVISLSSKVLQEDEELVDPLEFHIETLSLSAYLLDDPDAQENIKSFCALSYTWADNRSSDATKTIHIDGCSFDIRNNLHSALIHLSRGNLGRIWVDQICIDQENLAEKSQQVAFMRWIYNFADVVHIWLGPLDQTLVKPTKELLEYFNLAWPQSVSIEETLQLLPEDTSDRDAWSSALDDICGRQWFQRTWTFEELILARCPVVWIGNGWCLFHVFAYGIRKALSLFSPVVLQAQYWHPVLDTIAIWELARVQANHELERPTFTDYLTIAGQRSTTKPRDKVYGIHGLLDPSLSPLIPVDYNSSVATIYEMAMRYSVEVDKDLGLLGSAGVWRDEVGKSPQWDLPSWVPDFSNIRPPMDYIISPLRENRLRVSCKSTFTEPGRVRLRGFVLGRIGALPAILNGASLVGLDGVGSKYDFRAETTVVPISSCARHAAGARIYDLEDIFDPDCQLQVGNLQSLTAALVVHDRNVHVCHECPVCDNSKDYPNQPSTKVTMLNLPPSVQSGDWLCLFMGTRLPTLLRPRSSRRQSVLGVSADVASAVRDSEPQFELVSTCFPLLVPRDDLRFLSEERPSRQEIDKDEAKDEEAGDNEWYVAPEWRSAFSCVCVDILLV